MNNILTMLKTALTDAVKNKSYLNPAPLLALLYIPLHLLLQLVVMPIAYKYFPGFLAIVGTLISLLPVLLLLIALLIPKEEKLHSYAFAGAMFLTAATALVLFAFNTVNTLFLRGGTLIFVSVLSLLLGLSKAFIGVDCLVLKWKGRVFSIILSILPIFTGVISLLTNTVTHIGELFRPYMMITLSSNLISLLPLIAVALYVLSQAKPAPKAPALDPRLIALTESYEAGNMTPEEYKMQVQYVLANPLK